MIEFMDEVRTDIPIEAMSQNINKLNGVLENARPKLEARLAQLNNQYHDKQHSDEVYGFLKDILDNLVDDSVLDDRHRRLLLESALRHDDGHSGSTHRQDIVGGSLSNEEHAVELMKQDLRSKLEERDLQFIEDSILATSFGQDSRDKLPDGKKDYYRPYKPETDSQKLLALADVGGFIKGWDGWVDESLRLLEESPQNTPDDIEAWLKNREGFVDFYISPMLEGVSHLLKPEYFKQLQQALEEIREEINSLKDDSNLKRSKYSERLEAIKKLQSGK